VARVIDVLGLPVGAQILDVGCGDGRHTHLLADAGFDVDGLDYSEDLLSRARARGTNPGPRYTRGDMRALPADWTGRFDAVVNLSTSFGFFRDPRHDVAAIGEFARVLRADGVLLWHGASRDGVVARFLARDWWTTADGTTIAQDRTFDPLSGLLRVESRWSGPRGGITRVHELRLYTATRLAELFAAAGLVVEAAWAGWRDRPLRRVSSEMLLVARRSAAAPAAPSELPRRRRHH
jgi:SAM-dependent methyltransferase